MTFEDFLKEAVNLKPNTTFTSFDKTGDLAGKVMFVKAVDKDFAVIIFPDGEEAETKISNLNVNEKSIKPSTLEKYLGK